MTGVNAFFWFLTGILFAVLYRWATYTLASKVLKRPGQLGSDTRSKFVTELSQDRLEEFKVLIERELLRREWS
jgi:hypothetical protein